MSGKNSTFLKIDVNYLIFFLLHLLLRISKAVLNYYGDRGHSCLFVRIVKLFYHLHEACTCTSVNALYVISITIWLTFN